MFWWHFLFDNIMVLTVINMYLFRQKIPKSPSPVTARISTPMRIIRIDRVLTRPPNLEIPTVMESRTSLTWSLLMLDTSLTTKPPTIIKASPITYQRWIVSITQCQYLWLFGYEIIQIFVFSEKIWKLWIWKIRAE